MKIEKALVWFRRDLRDHDHAALSAALAEAQQVYCAFVFDSEILDALPAKRDRRVISSVNRWSNWMPHCAPRAAG
jgi:deoxyribodipyrimidine photo-lyase